MKIRGIGFDIDGTLYPNWMMFLWSAPSFVIAPLVTSAFSRTRTDIRIAPPSGPFRAAQTEMAARILGRDPARVGKVIDSCLYGLWEKTAAVIRPLPGMREALSALRDRGYRLGALSDFPPARKLAVLKVSGHFSCAISAEESGRLKPDPKPFLDLAERLGLEPAEMLYVGNSYSKDIIGAKGAGMLTAFFNAGRRKEGPLPDADIVFSRYAELPPAVENLQNRPD